MKISSKLHRERTDEIRKAHTQGSSTSGNYKKCPHTTTLGFLDVLDNGASKVEG